MLDAIVTFGLVAAAAVYVAWRLFLSRKAKQRIRGLLNGQAECCPADEASGQCPGGCSGCDHAAPAPRQR
ncbi:hypothetical protein [Hoeflea olei]|uniref:FeoB-associated Cys-rich membrane protein n=1 Tax=Hoeflea olei TaxID=1480615 RepID=A0A1C1YVF8_9HYPH|nr:hypothetical protein [Hoeflea olei]OCW57523.1 hypothetical protein AWJ14_13300 [Hoeflea olei]